MLCYKREINLCAFSCCRATRWKNTREKVVSETNLRLHGQRTWLISRHLADKYLIHGVEVWSIGMARFGDAHDSLLRSWDLNFTSKPITFQRDADLTNASLEPQVPRCRATFAGGKPLWITASTMKRCNS